MGKRKFKVGDLFVVKHEWPKEHRAENRTYCADGKTGVVTHVRPATARYPYGVRLDPGQGYGEHAVGVHSVRAVRADPASPPYVPVKGDRVRITGCVGTTGYQNGKTGAVVGLRTLNAGWRARVQLDGSPDMVCWTEAVEQTAPAPENTIAAPTPAPPPYVPVVGDNVQIDGCITGSHDGLIGQIVTIGPNRWHVRLDDELQTCASNRVSPPPNPGFEGWRQRMRDEYADSPHKHWAGCYVNDVPMVAR